MASILYRSTNDRSVWLPLVNLERLMQMPSMEIELADHIQAWLHGQSVKCPVCGKATEEGDDCPDDHYEKFQNVYREFPTYSQAIVYLNII